MRDSGISGQLDRANTVPAARNTTTLATYTVVRVTATAPAATIPAAIISDSEPVPTTANRPFAPRVVTS